MKRRFRMRKVGIIVAIVVTLSLAAGGTAYASQDSLPGDALYPVKLTLEGLMLNLPADDAAKVGRGLDFAERRIWEMEVLTAEGRPEALNTTADKYGIAIAEIAEQIGTGNNTAAELVAAATAIHLEVLANVWEIVPEQAQAAIAAAINASATGHAAAVAALGEMGVGPSDIPGMPDEVRQRLEDILGGTLPASGPSDGVPPDNGEDDDSGPPERVPEPPLP
jgi:hypothetical protein